MHSRYRSAMVIATRIITGVALLTLSAGVARSQANQTSQDQTILITTHQASVAVGSEVRITATITNISNHPIDEAISTNGEDISLRLIVRDEQQRILAEKPPDQTPCHKEPGCEVVRMKIGNLVGMKLAPGKSYGNDFVLTELYNLSKPGKYFVQVVRGEIGSATLKSNILTITVVPQL